MDRTMGGCRKSAEHITTKPTNTERLKIMNGPKYPSYTEAFGAYMKLLNIQIVE